MLNIPPLQATKMSRLPTPVCAQLDVCRNDSRPLGKATLVIVLLKVPAVNLWFSFHLSLGLQHMK